MEAFDLNGFAEGEELNPSAYNPEDYPTKEEMLDFIYSNSHKPPQYHRGCSTKKWQASLSKLL